ncbi:cpw-wpc domain-containing protein [Toxoplasma gondii RUB]|uniref:Cpw-wpc domain-containing protein n=5 Tax=Toxoplasma gondii TaxID=5811 RepID=A0A086LKG1_TOXGO|nr:cpw-wpc domain-containing protein [Toxoplasma gondii FOU]KFG43543.1 cpw-wpc domain-containing protein [Toxoplasma gondii p89]KFG57129.1 cpw-wpc domain-containing protein [Toxoplasma gondii RUB]KFH04079.1 cpw-wpc domain-containing protein [Toxoplasma gondii VAND]PUA88419.1 cpw-wpc domain-containing protein [Toxoplasma gondii TgCATBr9]
MKIGCLFGAALIAWTTRVDAFRAAYRLLSNLEPTAGAYQRDMWGHPIKVANPGYQWAIPAGQTVNDPVFGSLPSAPGVPVAGTTGTNLLYGQTTTLSGQSLSPAPPGPTMPPPAGELPVVVGMAQGAAAATSAQLYAARQPAPAAAATGNVPIVSAAAVPAAAVSIPSLGGTLANKVLEFLTASSSVPNRPFTYPLMNTNIPLTIKQVLKEQARKAAWQELEPPADLTCPRNYAKKCPAGWEEISDTECRAPVDYSGPCPHILAFEAKTPQDKSQISLECKMRWPCMDAVCDARGGRNYSLECPEGWSYNGKCIAPADYKGHCEAEQDLSGLPAADKERFAVACQVEWPCQQVDCGKELEDRVLQLTINIIRDYTHTCPNGWFYDAEAHMCRPPSGFASACSDTRDLQRLTPQARQAFAAECNVRWPCVEQTTVASCKRAYSTAPCPSGWMNLMDSGACRAPESFASSTQCPSLTHFDFMSEHDKQEFERRCRVTWPCEGQATRNCSGCPIGWQRIPRKPGWCEPGPLYTGPCKRPQEWGSLSDDQKQTLLKLCNIDCYPIDTINGAFTLTDGFDATRLLTGTAASDAHTLT